MDAASLVIVLHGELLRTCSSVVQEHFQGLAQAGWYPERWWGWVLVQLLFMMSLENVVGQACERVSLHSNSLRNSRESVKNYSVFA